MCAHSGPGLVTMLRPSAKVLLTIEILVCFGPVLLLLVVGVTFAPIQLVVATRDPLNWHSALTVVGQVTCGLIGTGTLAYVVGKLFAGEGSISRPMLVCIGIALGALAVSPLLSGSPLGWILIGLLPLAASTHIVFLARRMLFSSWRDGLVKAAVATTVALSFQAVLNLDPSRASDSDLRGQIALWEQRAPNEYMYTVQLSGYPDGWQKSREALMPKRITVQGGTVVAARYLWDTGVQKAGDPAPMQDLWTIDRAFAELLAAEQQGWEIKVRSNDRWGFIEQAHAFPKSDASLSGWSLEIRDFSVISQAAEGP